MSKAILVREAAELLRLSGRTVYQLLNAGKLTGFRVGRSWRIDPDDLRRYIDSRRQSGQSPAA